MSETKSPTVIQVMLASLLTLAYGSEKVYFPFPFTSFSNDSHSVVTPGAT